MLDDAGLVDLMRSIAAQGFFPGEPILVVESTTPGRHLVVEGNRRFAATLLLTDPDLAPVAKQAVAAVAKLTTPDSVRTIPSLVFPDYRSILVHLGYRHVTGVKEWEPLAKARYLRRRFEDLEETSPELEDDEKFRVVARTIGSRADYVGRLLTSLAIYDRWEDQDFFGLTGVTEESVQFSLLSSAIAYANIYAFIGLESARDLNMGALDDHNLRFLLSYLFEEDADGLTPLRESRNLGPLAKVLGHQEARAALVGGQSLADSVQLLAEDNFTLRAVLTRADTLVKSASDRVDTLNVSTADLEQISALRDRVSDLLEQALVASAGPKQ